MHPLARYLRPIAPIGLAALLSASALAQTATLPLAAPPVAPNAAAGAIFDAMLAISRAVLTNPAAAQAASFNYAAAIQRYNSGDLSAAQREALQAISASAQAPFPLASSAPLPLAGSYRPATLPGIVNPAQADAEAFLAIARRALATCALTGPAQRAPLQQRYETAVREYVEQRYTDVRTDARAIIDACAAPSKSGL